MQPSTGRAAVLAVVVVSLTACAGTDDDTADATDPTSTAEAGATPVAGATAAPPGDDASGATDSGTSPGGTPAGAALFLVPEDVTHVTITDFDAIRARLGVPDMTSDWLMTDRVEFWEQVPASTVLLTDGALREDNSLFMLEYGFTQDDVDWEARWAGEAPGMALGLRPDLGVAGVERALTDEVDAVAGAELVLPERVVVRGAVGPEALPLATDPAIGRLADVDAESLYLRRGCIPFHDALGVDATIEHQDEVTAAHDVEALLPVEAVAVAFTGRTATFRLAYPAGTGEEEARADLAARSALAADWPLVESITFADGFDVAQPSPARFADGVGELDYPVTAPGGAAHLSLTEVLPVGVCNEVPPMPEPTGL